MKNKMRTFWGWKPSKNKSIESYQNVTSSYIKKYIPFYLSIAVLKGVF